jgi:hypothetical protein
MTKKKNSASYEPIHQQSRFWIHSEACYTEQELNQRSGILKARAQSEIHPDYLTNPSTWFAEDSQALINAYENSWFFSNAFKTRHVLTQDDFHVQPIDSQRLQWPSLYDLMQKTGDYLLVRNQKLSQEHLNQPINFFLLDLNNILKGLSQNPNIKQTQEQLEHLTRYVRTIEKGISPFVSTDRLFLANFRNFIDDEVHPYLVHKIESQLLRDRLGELLKTIKQLSTDRNRILHFALNINPVNPHPYTFAIEQPDNLIAYPTQAVKKCGKMGTEMIDNPMSALKLTIEQLRDCPNFQLINMQADILDHYANAISNLNELDQFQHVISQTIDLLGQAGEVFTVHQFKEQLSLLLRQIDFFIDSSSHHINEIISANSEAYHKAIQDKQNLPFLKQWLGSEREKLATFIRNQDTLAQFPSTKADLAKTTQAVQEHVSHVFVHLSKPKIKETDFAALSGQATELNALINSMHHWIKIQYELQGLEPPKTPETLKLLPEPQLDSQNRRQTAKPESLAFQLKPRPSSISTPAKSNFFYAPPSSEHSIPAPPAIAPASENEGGRIIKPQSFVDNFYLGSIALVPIGILALYLLYNYRNKSEVKTKRASSKEEFEKMKEQLDDLITEIQRVKDKNNQATTERLEFFMETYDQLNKKALAEHYDIEELKELYDDIDYFYKEYYEEKSPTCR